MKGERQEGQCGRGQSVWREGCDLTVVVVLVGMVCASCATSTKSKPGAPADWLAWQAKRRESLGGTNGWTTLVGLHWLREGPNFAGSDPTNNAVLPGGRAPAQLGSFLNANHSVRFESAPGVVAAIGGSRVETAQLETDRNGSPTKLQVGPLSIVVIERGDRVGLRVRDPEAPTRIHFRAPSYYAYDPAWRIEARFEPFGVTRKFRVADVTGSSQEMDSPGALIFTWQGAQHRLDVVEEPGESELFIMFHDLTAGKSTYPAGRFLYVNKPDAGGNVTIDFNRSFSPPCAFTAFATCPIPPRQNWLPFKVFAGERAPAGH